MTNNTLTDGTAEMRRRVTTTFPLPLTGIDLRKGLLLIDENPNKVNEDKMRIIASTLFDHKTTISLAELAYTLRILEVHLRLN